VPAMPPVRTMPLLRCEILADFARVEQLSAQWDRLWKADPVGEIFQSFAWNRAWWRAYNRDFELCCVVVWNDGKVIGILPLMLKGHTVRFMGAPQSDYTDILAEESDVALVLATAARALFHSRGWKECIFEHLSSQSRIVRHWSKLPPELRKALCLVPARHSPTILLQNDAGLLNKLAEKKHLRRHERKLEKSGSFNFRFLQTRYEIQQHLAIFFRYQIRSRVLRAEKSDCLSPEFSELLRALVEELNPREQLRFGLLEWNGQPLAYHLGFQVNDKFTMYQQAFDVDAWDYSPGEVLLRQLFLYAADHVTREFDFSVGYEFYKSRFANHLKENFTLYMERPSLLGRVRRFL
jgi:CelD/BcsL family acetyltransferase involved in cellulose biosynthesis